MISRETYSRINNNVAVMIFSFILPHSPHSLSHSRSHSRCRSRSRSRPFLRFSRYRTLVSYVINRVYSNIYIYIYIYIYIHIYTHIYPNTPCIESFITSLLPPPPPPSFLSFSLSHSHRLYKRSVRFSITKSGWKVKSDLADRRSRSVSPRSRRKRNRWRGEDTLRESRKDSRRLYKGRVSPERDSVGDLKLLSSSLDSPTKGIAEGNSD